MLGLSPVFRDPIPEGRVVASVGTSWADPGALSGREGCPEEQELGWGWGKKQNKPDQLLCFSKEGACS